MRMTFTRKEDIDFAASIAGEILYHLDIIDAGTMRDAAIYTRDRSVHAMADNRFGEIDRLLEKLAGVPDLFAHREQALDRIATARRIIRERKNAEPAATDIFQMTRNCSRYIRMTVEDIHYHHPPMQASAVKGILLGELLFHMEAMDENMRDVTVDMYRENRRIRDALSMRIQAFGETLKEITARGDALGIQGAIATRKLARDFREIRNVLAHKYGSANAMFPWKVHASFVPKIRESLAGIFRAHPGLRTFAESIADTMKAEENAAIGQVVEDAKHASSPGPKG